MTSNINNSIAYCPLPGAYCILHIPYSLFPIAIGLRGVSCVTPDSTTAAAVGSGAVRSAWGEARAAMGNRRRHGAWGLPRGLGVGGMPTQ